ncbi:MAG: DUF883 family protein [Gammaproteobacteria bacterium]|nr:DUF883 family protein [Gammaproteobacteria bacterium]
MADAEARTLGEELRALADEAEALLRAGLHADAGELKEQAAASLAELRARLDRLEGQLNARTRELDRYVRENPWQALALAGGVALLAGLLLGRRR